MKKPIMTPVLFLIFNRPDTTQRVFDEIRKAKPPKLFVAADGPREGKEGESEKCQQTREIIKKVNWDCAVHTLFRDKNLGCKSACSSAVDWFFENEEEGIVLEDDTLPNQSFFWFCQELLEYYRNDKRVMHVSGDNFQNGIIRGDGSYYFSKYNYMWGWATWRRAWVYYDVNMKTWPKFREQNQIANISEDKSIKQYWLKNFQAVYGGKIDTWDFQWTYTIWSQNGLTILPNVNLVSNIGFGEGATHTMSTDDKVAAAKTETIQFPLIHPTHMICNQKADKYTHQVFTQTMFKKIKNKLTGIFNEHRKNAKCGSSGFSVGEKHGIFINRR